MSDKTKIDDLPRVERDVRVEIYDTANPFKLTLYFAGWEPEARFERFTVEAKREAELDPKAFARLARNMAGYVVYGRALLAERGGDKHVVTEIHRGVGTSPKGYHDDFYSGIVVEYCELKASGDPSPVKTMRDKHSVHITRVYAWLRTARERGLCQ